MLLKTKHLQKTHAVLEAQWKLRELAFGRYCTLGNVQLNECKLLNFCDKLQQEICQLEKLESCVRFSSRPLSHVHKELTSFRIGVFADVIVTVRSFWVEKDHKPSV